MAARSTQIKFTNSTNYLLVLTDSYLYHGIWNGGPVDQISPNASNLVLGQNDSNGTATGAQGTLTYAIIGINSNKQATVEGYVSIGWDNPFIGSNSYSNSVSSRGTINFQVSNGGGSGDNATVTYNLSVK
jgi:hypothetical protein